MPKKKSRAIYVILSLIVTVGLIGLLISRIEIRDLIETIKAIYLPYLGIFCAVALIISVLRARRYQILLKPETIPFGSIFCVTLIRNIFVDLLPARIGSLSYIYLMNKRLRYSFETSASTFLLSMVFDFLTLSPFLLLAIFVVGMGVTAISSAAMMLAAAVFLGAVGLCLWKLPELLRLITSLLKSILLFFGWMDKKWASTGLEKLELTVRSLKAIQKQGIYWPVFGLSLVIRGAKYVSLYFLLAALLRGHGFSLKSLSFFKTILGITGAELTSALPIKGLGGFGTWESAWALTFQMMDFDSKIAIISGIGVHLITNLFEYSLGIAAIFWLALPYLRKHRT